MDEKLINKLKQRGQNIWDTVSGKPVYGQESPALVDRALRVTGQLGGGTGDVMGSLLGLAGKGIGNVVEVLPEKVKKETPHRIAALKKMVGDIELPRTGETVREAKNDLVNVLKKSFEEMEKKKPHSTEAVEDIINTGDLVDLAIGAGIGKQIFKKGAQKELRTEALKKVLVPPGIKKTILGTAGGGAIGAQFGETPEERRKNALVGALLGGGAVNLKNIRKGLKGLGESGQISVFHGSPHKFEEFNIAKIGTGEGAQAFGHGLYFTDEKDIARNYAKMGTDYTIPETETLKYNFGLTNEHAKNIQNFLAIKSYYDPLDAPDVLKIRLKEALKYKGKEPNATLNKIKDLGYDNVKNYWDNIEKIIKSSNNKLLGQSENLYTVTLHKGKTPDQYDYLKWENNVGDSQIEKIIKQAEKEKIALPTLGRYDVVDGKHWVSNVPKPAALAVVQRSGGRIKPSIGNVNGGQAYQEIIRKTGSDKAASEFLLRAGIDGIDYPAGTLSDVKSNARNYVVFDPRAATIEAVNDKELLSHKLPKLSPKEGGGIINDLNPTGSVFADYTPSQRTTLPLGDNITTLDKIMNKPADEMITIYRGGGEIAAGDFITTNKQLAKDYAGAGKVYEKKVRLSDILDDKTEPLGEEYIYRPKISPKD